MTNTANCLPFPPSPIFLPSPWYFYHLKKGYKNVPWLGQDVGELSGHNNSAPLRDLTEAETGQEPQAASLCAHALSCACSCSLRCPSCPHSSPLWAEIGSFSHLHCGLFINFFVQNKIAVETFSQVSLQIFSSLKKTRIFQWKIDFSSSFVLVFLIYVFF